MKSPARDTEQGEVAWLHQRHALDLAVISELEAERNLNRDKITNLEIALGTARCIGSAMGILMARFRISDTEAFEALRKESQRTHRKLREIAEDVVLTGTIE